LSTANFGAIGIAMIVSGLVLGTLTPAGVCIACGLVGLLALLIATRVPPRRRDSARSDGPEVEAPQLTRQELSLAC
jgi:hypothetical protein